MALEMKSFFNKWSHVVARGPEAISSDIKGRCAVASVLHQFQASSGHRSCTSRAWSEVTFSRPDCLGITWPEQQKVLVCCHFLPEHYYIGLLLKARIVRVLFSGRLSSGISCKARKHIHFLSTKRVTQTSVSHITNHVNLWFFQRNLIGLLGRGNVIHCLNMCFYKLHLKNLLTAL